MREVGIYIHIPFCLKKCKYCDFISFENKFEYSDEYINSLIKSINNVNILKNIGDVNKIKDEIIIDTIYFGGGTPSSIKAENIENVINAIKGNFKLKDNIEITIEINPGAVDETKLLKYRNIGINRISIGLQSTQDDVLKSIGRIHTYESFLNTYGIVKKVGFDNINVDLMLGLPNQTLKSLEESLIEIINLKPNHISLYSLILENGTVLEKEVNQGILVLPEENIERKMYHKTKSILEKNGYVHYEISNFAKKGYESKHNVNCWKQKEYLSFGLASHSYINQIRFSYIDDLENYIKNINEGLFEKNIIIHEIQNKENEMKEYMMLGFRMLNRNIHF